MHNLYAKIAKILEICKQFSENLVNESGMFLCIVFFSSKTILQRLSKCMRSEYCVRRIRHWAAMWLSVTYMTCGTSLFMITNTITQRVEPTPLHLNLLQVIRHYDSSFEVLCGFTCVVLLAGGYGLFFRVIEDEVLYVEFCCELSCVKSRTVVFLVWLEGVAVGVEAESLAHHPVGM